MNDITEAVSALRAGGIVGIPTDTVYGLAVDPYRQDTLETLFDLKGRPLDKPFALLVASIEQAMSLARFTDDALDLADRFWPGGLTLVLTRLPDAPLWLGHRTRRTIGLRCPDHPVALELLRTAGPLVVTSANRAGEETVRDDAAARAIFGDVVALYLEGFAPGGMASTIIDLTEPTPLVLRKGPVFEP